MQSEMSPGLVCRVIPSRMIIFDWVMARGAWLKKNILNYSYSVRGRKAM